MSERKVYTYKLTMDVEVSFEGEDETDAADTLHTFLDHEGLDSDYVEVKLVDKVPTEEFEGKYRAVDGQTKES